MNLTGILMSQKTEDNESPEMKLSRAFRDAGLIEPPVVIMDGEIHRFHANRSKDINNDSGWYVFFRDGNAVNGYLGDWSQDLQVKFSTFGAGQLSASEQELLNRRAAEAAQKAREEREKRQEQVSKDCSFIWEASDSATYLDPYIVRKGLKSAYGARCASGKLVLPLMDREGRVWSLQFISADGTKKYMPGGRVKGLFYCVGKDPQFLAEGFATAASVFEATGKGCLVAFSAGNLEAVSEQFPNAIIVADNDKSGTGEDKAKKCKGGYILIPELGMDANDYASKYGLEELKKLLIKPKHKACRLGDWIMDVPPRQWLLKNWILKGPAFQMTFGASGSGKTFVDIDRMLKVAMNGYRVMYLCGEGPQSAKARCKVWVQEHNVDLKSLSDNVLIVEEAFKLDSPEGINLIYRIVDDYGFVPDFIVVDTLICFMSGDENDTKAANQFITYCKEVYNHYGCTLLVTHHTGLSEDAQKRARGSSAFKGALDMQDLVTKKDDRITIEQIKNKGGRIQESQTYMLEDHEVDGLYEEDGSLQTCAVLVPTDSVEEAEPQLSAQEKLTLEIFQYGHSYFVLDEPRMTRDAIRDYIRMRKVEADPQAPDETNEEFDKRIGSVTRKALSRLLEDNPLLIPLTKDKKGNPVEYACRKVTLYGGIVEPNFTMNLISKMQASKRDISVTLGPGV